ncbi:unnamed protein product [marine sediment metagenome]|uniref:TRASH domain-containing protein n=1 Tax=marine sediment metagenome TaxID=412755 RepID=X1L536_9ZZZZ
MAKWLRSLFSGGEDEMDGGGKKAKDPVCGMDVDDRATAPKSRRMGITYYFCSPNCKKAFDENPKKYSKEKSERLQSCSC